MKRVFLVIAICLFVFAQFGFALAEQKCDDPSTYQWDPKSGKCIEKIKEQKCDDPSKFQWDPQSGKCVEK